MTASIMLRVVLDTESSAEDVLANIAAIGRLRGVKHVEQDGFTIDASVDELGLTTRSRNALLNAEIPAIKDLVRHSRYELSHLKHLGKKGLREIEAKLAVMGARLRPQTSAEFAADIRRRQASLQPPQQAPLAEIQRTLRRLWESLSARGYVNQDLIDWRAVDSALGRHVCAPERDVRP